MKREIDQVRDEVLLRGAEELLDSQLLGLVLSNAALGKIICTANACRQIDKVYSPMRRAQLMALVELARRICSMPCDRGQRITYAADISGIYRPRLSSRDQEHFIALALNNKNQILSEILVGIGTVNQALVRPADVFKSLIAAGAVRVAFIHNHPSGDPTFSTEDIALFRRLTQVGDLTDIPVLDFLVVASGGFSSARELGILTPL
jgi:DNA repair protein RadC